MAQESLSRTDETAGRITHYITSKRMKPGDKMPTETEMIGRLGVSRSTLREAVRILSARNVLEVRQGSGTFISERCGVPDDPLGLTFIYDDDRLALDLLDVRILIEPHTAMLAAIYATDVQRQNLLEQCTRVEELIRKHEPYEEDDITLHTMIAEASGNRVLHKMSYIMQLSVKQNVKSTGDVFRDTGTYNYHRKTVEAIVRRDPQGASNAMMCHLAQNREYITAKLDELKAKKKAGEVFETR